MDAPDLASRDALTAFLAPVDIEPIGDPAPIGDEYGYGSSRAAVTVRLPDGQEREAVVKVWDGNAHGYDEIEFYEVWAPQLPIRLPECLATHATDEQGLLVLERVQGRQGDDEGRASPEEACSLARYLAAVHLASVGSTTALAERGRTPRPGEWHDARRVSLADRHGLPESEPARSILVQSETADRLAVELMRPAHSGLTHSDVHLDNVLFTDDGPVLLDWARLGWGPAALDLGSLLVSSVRPDDYDTVVGAYRRVAEVTEEALRGALLYRVITGTLGMVRWEPRSPRQARLKETSLAKAADAATWLGASWPELRFHLEV